MDRYQKQSIILMISNIETQLATLRQLVGMTGLTGKEETGRVAPPAQGSDMYTSDQEDDEIERALKIEDERDSMLQDIFLKARETEPDDLGV